MLALPVGSELNPIAANWPALAVTAKTLVCVALCRWSHPYAIRIQAFGAATWSLGAASNLAVITAY